MNWLNWLILGLVVTYNFFAAGYMSGISEHLHTIERILEAHLESEKRDAG